MKYIIFETPLGDELPILFPNHINHCEVAHSMKTFPSACLKPISAGSCNVNYLDHSIMAYGESMTLNLNSRPQDSQLIQRVFREL